MSIIRKYIIPLTFAITLLSCKEHYAPKPQGYFRLDFPKHEYIESNFKAPYSFEHTKYGKIEKSKAQSAEQYWFDLVIDTLNASIHLSYKPIINNVAQYIEDSRTMTYKHAIKADAINKTYINRTKDKVYGIVYTIKGNAASAVQFHLTDSTRHFVRGALYFNLQPNYDSLGPVISYIQEDIDHMIETFKWN